MKQILFVNDSYFTYLLAKPLIEKYHNSISLVVFSTRINRSISAIKNVYKKTYIKYFAYRLGVELFSRYLGLFKGESISCLVKRYNLRSLLSG